MESEKVLGILNRARAEELACIQLYAQNARFLEESGHSFLAWMFRDQMAEEVMHARWLSARILALGGTPTHEPAAWCRKRGARRGAPSVRRMIREAGALERRELALYEKAILECALSGDLETKVMLEHILDVEGNHQDQWARLLTARD